MKSKKLLSMLLATLLFTGNINTSYAFSDEYEVFYPQLSAESKSAEEILTDTISPGQEISDDIKAERLKVIQMYKNVGIDVAFQIDEWLQNKRMIDDMPQTWSKDTPKPLSGDYEQYFSVDACWNNKIPQNNPRVKMEEIILNRRFQLTTVKTKADMAGNGIGIPEIIGKVGDKEYSLVEAYDDEITKAFKVKAPANFEGLVNQVNYGDQHAVFIDDETKTLIHSWLIRTPSHTGRDHKYGFDMRSHASSVPVAMDGIGAEGRAGTDCIGVPISAFTVKPSELKDSGRFIEHALGGAVWPLMRARVYPANSMDSWMSTAEGYRGNLGAVPYGAIMQLDPQINLEKLYNEKKLSLLGYKILKAWQEYGFYNIDASGADNGPGFLAYTSTTAGDWINKEKREFDVPFCNNAQGYEQVQKELNAFINGDPFFGSIKPDCFITVPVVKYAKLDVNNDLAVTSADYDETKKYIGQTLTESNAIYDVNQDKQLSERDSEIIYNYLNDLPQHKFEYKKINETKNPDGQIKVGFSVKDDYNMREFKKGTLLTVCAVPNPGYEFDSWTGDFEGESGNIVTFKIDDDINIGVKYKRTTDNTLTLISEGNGNITGSYTKNGDYSALKSKYGKGSEIYLKATPNEGYVFDEWIGDFNDSVNPFRLTIDKDTNITASFKKVILSENFLAEKKPDNIELVFGKKNSLKFTKGGIIMTDWADNAAVLNTDTLLNRNYEMKVNIKSAAGSNGNKAKIYFNYKNINNYYVVEVGSLGQIILKKNLNGIMSTIRTSRTKFPFNLQSGVTFKIIYDDKKYISVVAYQNGNKFDVFNRVKDKSITSGYVGLGASNNAAINIKDLIVFER